MSFDLKKNNLADKAESGFEFEIKLPEIGTPTGMFFTIRGQKAKKVKEYSRKKFKEINDRIKYNQKFKKDEDFTPEEAEELSVDAAVVRVISFKGVFEDGVEVEFNESNLRRILSEHDWIREQIIQESDNIVNFI